MRLHLQLTPNTQAVPFNYQHFLVGAFHKWLGWNQAHDTISLYSMSWLQGGEVVNNTLHFANGATMFISFWDTGLAKKTLQGALRDNLLFCGMTIQQIQMQEDPRFGTHERFIAASPILVKKQTPENRTLHLGFNDAEAAAHLTDTLKRKLSSVNLDLPVKVSFDQNYAAAKTKLVTINGIANKANLCPVLLEGDPLAIQFAWNVGVGNSTGSCFGAVK
ncbi:MAG: CRISPR-associated endoribonuclease Cas6 [Ignavibacteriales bacterium]|nr:CRISPR-associated endoribonuclease Cas6 [Ignavibacteriales bacterium]